MKAHAADAASKRRRKGPAIHDFQLFDKDRLDAIAELERTIAAKKEESINTIKELRTRARDAPSFSAGAAPGQSHEELTQLADQMESQLDSFVLSKEDQEEKEQLLKEGFPDWSKRDFKAFVASLERHGRYNLDSITQDMELEVGKEKSEVHRYFVAFWLNYRRIADWKKVIDRVEKGESKILRLRQIRDAIQEKVERHLEETFGQFYWDVKNGKERLKKLPPMSELLKYSWPRMRVNYGAGFRGRSYQEEEDAFLICMMHCHGYGAAERIRMEIRRAWQFRFDWYFKSRNALEIQKRCDFLVKVVERENEEVRKKEQRKLAPIAETAEEAQIQPTNLMEAM
jgi:SWI/SNF-related matrix-associated actin-dependent regulator of chromatin subfamily A member 5